MSEAQSDAKTEQEQRSTPGDRQEMMASGEDGNQRSSDKKGIDAKTNDKSKAKARVNAFTSVGLYAIGCIVLFIALQQLMDAHGRVGGALRFVGVLVLHKLYLWVGVKVMVYAQTLMYDLRGY